MASDARKLIADVHYDHEWRGGILGCRCGWNWPEERTWFCGEEERIAKAHAAHVAAEIDKAFGGLTRRWGIRYDGEPWPEEVFDTQREADSEAANFCTACDHCRNSLPRQVESGWVSDWSEP